MHLVGFEPIESLASRLLLDPNKLGVCDGTGKQDKEQWSAQILQGTHIVQHFMLMGGDEETTCTLFWMW